MCNLPTRDVTADHFRELERRRTAALVARDLALAERLHAPHYQLITPSGKCFGRADYLGAVASGELRYVAWEHDRMEVRLCVGMAIVRYKAMLHFDSGRTIECWHTDSYERGEPGWQAVWSQATLIREPSSGAGS